MNIISISLGLSTDSRKNHYFRALGIPLPSSTTQGFDPLSGLMDEQEAENDLDKLDPILDGLYYEEI